METSKRVRRWRWLSAFIVVAFSLFALKPGASYAQAKQPTAYGKYFPQTGQAASGAFWQYWSAKGGLEQQGYPLSEELTEVSDTNGKEYLVQYYERAVFEYHPETPKTLVLLSLLGRFEYDKKYPRGASGQVANTSAGSRLFKETNKRLGGRFLNYWNTHGGLAQQGFPISEEFQEKSANDGKTYTVQYFERAVFEYHPEQKEVKFQVLLSRLGASRYEAKHQSNLHGAPGDTDGDSIMDDANQNGKADPEDDLCPRSPENINQVFDTDGCPDTMMTLLVFAAEDIDAFWADFFVEEGVKYKPPVDFIAYFEEGQFETECGDVELDNAFFCEGNHGIYFDYNFLQSQLDEDGDFAPVVIIAHEWGHLVQANLGILDDPHYLTIQTEQQADCFAGAWAAHAGEHVGGSLDEGDLDEAANALFRAGDDEETPWFDPDAHGTPQQRINAFQLGLDEGPYACFDFTP